MMNALAGIDAAREILPERPSRALRALPPPKATPRALRDERDFLEAEARRAMGFFNAAEALYRRVLRGKDDPVLFVEACLGSAAGLRSVGRVRDASARIKAARTAAKRSGLRAFKERFALEAAMILRAAGFYAESLRRLKPLLERALRSGEWGEVSFIYWAVGGAERFRGRLADSEKAYLRSLAMARRARDRIAQGYAEFGLGGITRVRGKLALAARYYSRAAGAFRSTDDFFARAYAECGYANALRQLGRLAQAERHYRRSHKIYSSLGDAVDLAYVDWGLGQIRLLQGRPRSAVPFLRKSLAAFQRGSENRGIVLAKKSLAEALHAIGRSREGEAFFAGAYRLARRTGLHAHLERYT
ncbi:MAG: tetratricopeptide repeat protein [Elusimicrobiota bacterium]